MPGLRPLPARAVIRALAKAGYHFESQKGSHVKLRGPQGTMLIVPIHPGRPLKLGLLRAIVRQAGLSVDEFLRLHVLAQAREDLALLVADVYLEHPDLVRLRVRLAR